MTIVKIVTPALPFSYDGIVQQWTSCIHSKTYWHWHLAFLIAAKEGFCMKIYITTDRRFKMWWPLKQTCFQPIVKYDSRSCTQFTDKNGTHFHLSWLSQSKIFITDHMKDIMESCFTVQKWQYDVPSHLLLFWVFILLEMIMGVLLQWIHNSNIILFEILLQPELVCSRVNEDIFSQHE